jgi:hypothetical protein
MSTAVVVAVTSGGLSIAAAGISVFNQRSVTRLSYRLEGQRAAQTKQEQSAQLRARYRDPLLNAVFDLQSRLFNIVAKAFLVRYASSDDDTSSTYAVASTLYVVAEYLGWVEIIRREVQFLDLGDERSNRDWLEMHERVRDTLARDDLDPALRVFRGEQRAIGELMAVGCADAAGARRHECLGYASFVEQLSAAKFSRWFEKLKADLALLVAEPEAHFERAVLLQNTLVDVLDMLDPHGDRFPAARRSKLAPSSPNPA